MYRRAREKSQSRIYHVMLRGANRQELFHYDEDSVRFLETIERLIKRLFQSTWLVPYGQSCTSYFTSEISLILQAGPD